MGFQGALGLSSPMHVSYKIMHHEQFKFEQLALKVYILFPGAQKVPLPV